MPFVAEPHVLMVRFAGHITTVPWANVLHFDYQTDPAPTSAQLAGMAASLLPAYMTRLGAYIQSITTVEECDVRDLTATTAASGVATGSHAGTDAGTMWPTDVCWVVSHSVAERYRGGHGRTYVPGGSVAAAADAHTWSSGLATAVATHFASLVGDVVAAWTTETGGTGLIPVIPRFSYATNPTPPPRKLKTYLRADPVLGHTCAARIGSQRRRR